MNKDRKTVYLIVMTENIPLVDIDADDIENIPTMDPVAVYSNLEDAETWTLELQKMSDKREGKDRYFFDIIEYEMDSEPLLLTFMKAEDDDIDNYLTKSIKALMDAEIIDQLIGEDGHFHYVLTEKGKGIMGDISLDALKELFKVEIESPDEEEDDDYEENDYE